MYLFSYICFNLFIHLSSYTFIYVCIYLYMN